MTPFSRAECRLWSRRGFTLIEMLVAIVISIILILALTQVISGASKSASSNNNSLLALSSANAALNLVVNDLRSLAASPQPSPVGAGGYEFLQVQPDPNTGNLNGTTPALLMLNACSAQDSISNANDLGLQPRAICYQMAYQDPINPSNTNPKAKVYGFYRTVQPSSTTFASFLGQSDLFATTGLWKSITAAALPSTSSFIVGNVVDFQLVFYACRLSSTGQLLTTPVPIYSTVSAGSGNAIHLTSSGYAISSTSANLDSAYTYDHGPVTYVDVTLVVLDNNGAVQLNDGVTTLAKAKTRYGHTLTRRVALPEPF